MIRHGQSEANLGLVTASASTAKLTSLGRLQAAAVAQTIVVPPALIVTSTMIRAQATAAPTIRRFPETPVETWPVQEFTYLDTQKYQGTTIAQRRPFTVEYWHRLEPEYRDGEDAETFAELFCRAGRILKKITSTPGRSLIFSHGQFMRAVLWRAMCDFRSPTVQAMRSFARFRGAFGVPNGAISKIGVNDNGGYWLSPIDSSHLVSELRSR